MSTPTIQLAFQGGGAKLAAMLPIAHAFRDAEQKGYIKIVRVSGTSAGAICAALISSHADFSAVRNYIASHGAAHFGELVPDEIRILAEQAKKGHKFNLFDLYKKRRIIRSVALDGDPLLNSGELRKFIGGVLNAGNPDCPEMIENCPAKLMITASDIVKSMGIVHESGELLAAVEDSCSLPILMRSFASLAESHNVDGGLCDNLPVDCLVKDNSLPIFAVYPKHFDEKTKNHNILSYFVSMISASINHNVLRSIEMVGKPFRFAAETTIGILDFEEAIKQLNSNSWYNDSYEETFDRLVSFSETYGYSLSASQARVVDAVDIEQLRETLFNLTNDRVADAALVEGIKATFVVRINDTAKTFATSRKLRRKPDTITRVSRLRVLTDDFRYYRATVNVAEDSIVPTIWSARNITSGKDIHISALPLTPGNQAGVAMRNCLLEFPEVGSISRNDIIELQSAYHSQLNSDLAKINMGQSDYFGFTNGTGIAIETVDLILIYPKTLGEIILHLDDTKSRLLKSDPVSFKPLFEEGGSLGLGESAVGMKLGGLDPGAAFFILAVPRA